MQEIDPEGNQKLVAYLSGQDVGPISKVAVSNWNKKIISVSTNQMNIEFKSDDSWEYNGFSAKIYFTPISNKECESWMDMKKKVFKSPNYPKTYASKKCYWIITVDQDFHITLNFIELFVRLSNIVGPQIVFIIIPNILLAI